MEAVDEDPDFDGGFAFGMEEAAGIALDGFEGVVEAFDGVGGTDMGSDLRRVLREGQVLIDMLAQVTDEGGRENSPR